MTWKPIETAPKGGGAEFTTDPEWVEPPVVLLHFRGGDRVTARWDWYYAEGGDGFDGRNAWVLNLSGERVADYQDEPTAWMPLPSPPEEST